MSKIALLWVLCLSWLLATTPASAQDETLWTAWLYNPVDGRMTLVDDTGEVLAAFNLPLPEGYAFYPFQAAVAQSGTRIGYVLADDATGARRVRVYSVPERDLLVDRDLSPLFTGGMGLATDETHRFNETMTALALGYRLTEGGWQIAILDLDSGLVTLSLRDTSPPVAAAAMPVEADIIPVVQLFAGSKVTFTMLQEDAGAAAPERGSYTWNLLTNTVSTNTPYPALDLDSWPAGGAMMAAAADPRLPNSSERFSATQTNTLYVYESESGAFFPFFNARDLSLYQPRFIQNTERVLVGGLNPEGETGWFVIERDGSGVGDWHPAEGTVVGSLKGTTDGFLYTGDTLNPDGGHTTLFLVNTRAGLSTGTPIWSSKANAYPRLAWVGDSREPESRAVRPWTRLEVPDI